VIIRPSDVHPVGASAACRELDLLTYGSPAPLGFDTARATRGFDLSDRASAWICSGPPRDVVVDQRPYLSERPYVRGERGDVALVHIENRGGEVHPMHLHGHHMVVLARNGWRRPGARGGWTH
jgi:hypothetical protein